MAKTSLCVDPAAFEAGMSARPERSSKLVLGLDLATTTGVAYTWYTPGRPYRVGHDPMYLGQWDLSPGENGSNPIRFVRLFHFLDAVRPDLVVFEDSAKNTPKGGSQGAFSLLARAIPTAVLLGKYIGTVQLWCEQRGVPADAFAIGEIKRRATGRGAANKKDVIRAANQLLGTDYDPETYEQTGADNICDAAFCLLLGLERYADGLPANVQPA